MKPKKKVTVCGSCGCCCCSRCCRRSGRHVSMMVISERTSQTHFHIWFCKKKANKINCIIYISNDSSMLIIFKILTVLVYLLRLGNFRKEIVFNSSILPKTSEIFYPISALASKNWMNQKKKLGAIFNSIYMGSRQEKLKKYFLSQSHLSLRFSYGLT